MTEPVAKKPLIPWGWLRALLFAVLYLVGVMVIAIPIGILIVLLNRDTIENGKQPDISALMSGSYLWLTVLVGLLVTLVLVFIFRKWIDRKSFVSLGFSFEAHYTDAITGMSLAVALLGTGSIILFLTGHLVWTDIDFNPSSLFVSLGILMMAAFSEELIFRGYILNNLMDSFNKWIALLISAILFALFHLGGHGIGFLPIVNLLLAGILLGINYVYTKNLWFAILLHLGWNFFEGPILGFNVSGQSLPGLLHAELKGDLLLTGGTFGFEGSIINMGLSVAAILIVYMIYEKKYNSLVLQPA